MALTRCEAEAEVARRCPAGTRLQDEPVLTGLTVVERTPVRVTYRSGRVVDRWWLGAAVVTRDGVIEAGALAQAMGLVCQWRRRAEEMARRGWWVRSGTSRWSRPFTGVEWR